MSKTAEFIKLLSVLVLSLVLVGMMGYFIPRICALYETPKTPDSTQVPAYQGSTPAGEKLAATIYATLEKITGPNSVRVSVNQETSQVQETIQKETLLPDTGVVKETVLQTPMGADMLTESQKTLYDFSKERQTWQNVSDQINRQSITVLIDGTEVKTHNGRQIYQPRSNIEMDTYTGLIKSIVGFDAARGDTLEIVNLPFASQTSDTLFGFGKALFIQSILLTFLFILCVLILVRFILPMIYVLIQPTPVTYTPISLPNKPSEQISGAIPLSKSHLIRNLFIQSPESALLLLKSWIYQQSDTDTPNGLQKTAILLLALGEDTIKSVFLKLPQSIVCDISRTMASLGTIQSETVQSVFDAFLSMNAGQSELNTSPAYVNQLLSTTLPKEKAEDLLKEINVPVCGKTIWEKLEKVNPDVLSKILINEYPQTIAVILYHLSNEQAGAILNLFPESLTMDVLMRLTGLGAVDTDTLHQVEKGLEEQLYGLFNTSSAKSGREKVSDILSLMDKKTDILNTLFERSPDMARQISAGVLSFEDIARWPDDSIRILLEHADRCVVVYALKGASDLVKNAFARNMSPAVWSSILKETSKTGAIKLKEIDEAQHALVKLAQELINQKKINIPSLKG